MDEIELETLDWFGHLMWDLEQLQLGMEAGDIQVESSFMKRVLVRFTPEALFISRHYLQALRMRHAAMGAGNLSWYVAATYALCHSWRKVLDSIPWMEWGGHCFDDRRVMALTVIVAGLDGLKTSKAIELSQSFAPGEAGEVMQKASDKDLVVLDDGRVYLGPKAPRPRARRV